MEKSMKIHHQITSNAFLYSLYTTDLCVCIGLFVTTDIVFMEQCNKLFSLWLFFRSMRVFLAFLWSFFFANDFSQTCGVNSCVFLFFFASAFAGRKSFSLRIFFSIDFYPFTIIINRNVIMENFIRNTTPPPLSNSSSSSKRPHIYICNHISILINSMTLDIFFLSSICCWLYFGSELTSYTNVLGSRHCHILPIQIVYFTRICNSNNNDKNARDRKKAM